MRISDWSSDVCSSDLVIDHQARAAADAPTPLGFDAQRICGVEINVALDAGKSSIAERHVIASEERSADAVCAEAFASAGALDIFESGGDASIDALERSSSRSEEHTAELH